MNKKPFYWEEAPPMPSPFGYVTGDSTQFQVTLLHLNSIKPQDISAAFQAFLDAHTRILLQYADQDLKIVSYGWDQVYCILVVTLTDPDRSKDGYNVFKLLVPPWEEHLQTYLPEDDDWLDFPDDYKAEAAKIEAEVFNQIQSALQAPHNRAVLKGLEEQHGFSFRFGFEGTEEPRYRQIHL